MLWKKGKVRGSFHVRLTNHPLVIRAKGVTGRTDNTILIECNRAIILMASATDGRTERKVSFFPLAISCRRGVCTMNGVPKKFLQHRNHPKGSTVLGTQLVSHPVHPLFSGEYHGSVRIVTAILSMSCSGTPRLYKVLNTSTSLKVSSVP